MYRKDVDGELNCLLRQGMYSACGKTGVLACGEKHT